MQHHDDHSVLPGAQLSCSPLVPVNLASIVVNIVAKLVPHAIGSLQHITVLAVSA